MFDTCYSLCLQNSIILSNLMEIKCLDLYPCAWTCMDIHMHCCRAGIITQPPHHQMDDWVSGAPLSCEFAELYNVLEQEVEESDGAQTQSPGCANLDETSFDRTQLDHDQQCQDSRYMQTEEGGGFVPCCLSRVSPFGCVLTAWNAARISVKGKEDAGHQTTWPLWTAFAG